MHFKHRYDRYVDAVFDPKSSTFQRRAFPVNLQHHPPHPYQLGILGMAPSNTKLKNGLANEDVMK